MYDVPVRKSLYLHASSERIHKATERTVGAVVVETVELHDLFDQRMHSFTMCGMMHGWQSNFLRMRSYFWFTYGRMEECRIVVFRHWLDIVPTLLWSGIISAGKLVARFSIVNRNYQVPWSIRLRLTNVTWQGAENMEKGDFWLVTGHSQAVLSQSNTRWATRLEWKQSTNWWRGRWRWDWSCYVWRRWHLVEMGCGTLAVFYSADLSVWQKERNEHSTQ